MVGAQIVRLRVQRFDRRVYRVRSLELVCLFVGPDSLAYYLLRVPDALAW